MEASGTTVVVAADRQPLLGDVRELIEEYAASLPFGLDFQGFAEEMATLPGAYAPPRGRLFVARSQGVSVGCVAVRPLSGDIAELKRLWVRPAVRGTGAGRLLITHAVEEARRGGYASLRLDTASGQEAAQALYRSLGFVDIPAYRHNPIEGSSFLQLTLRPS